MNVKVNVNERWKGEGTRFSGDGRSEMEDGGIPISHLPTSIFGKKRVDL